MVVNSSMSKSGTSRADLQDLQIDIGRVCAGNAAMAAAPAEWGYESGSNKAGVKAEEDKKRQADQTCPMCKAILPLSKEAEQHCEEAVAQAYCIVGDRMRAHNVPWHKAKRGRWIRRNEAPFFVARLVQLVSDNMPIPKGVPVTFAPNSQSYSCSDICKEKQSTQDNARLSSSAVRLNSRARCHRPPQLFHESFTARAMMFD